MVLSKLWSLEFLFTACGLVFILISLGCTFRLSFLSSLTPRRYRNRVPNSCLLQATVIAGCCGLVIFAQPLWNAFLSYDEDSGSPWEANGLFSTEFLSGGRFKEIAVGLSTLKGWVLCFGDFDSDTHTDVFMWMGDDMLEVYRWHESSNQYSRLHHASWNVSMWSFPDSSDRDDWSVSTAAMVDVDGDGAEDVLVWLMSKSTSVHCVYVLRGNYTHLAPSVSVIDDLKTVNSICTKGHAIVGDINGDQKLDLFGEDFKTGLRSYYLFETLDPLVNEQGKVKYHWKKSHLTENALPSARSYELADVDGDCASDWIIYSCASYPCIEDEMQLEFWRVNGSWTLDKVLRMPVGSSHPFLADFNVDSMVDIVVPVYHWYNDNNITVSLYVLYNHAVTVCPDWGKSSANCRKARNLCAREEQYFDIPKWNGDASMSMEWKMIWSQQISRSDYLLRNSFGTFSIGDVDLDGYPDILMTFDFEEAFSGSGYKRQTRLLRNMPCGGTSLLGVVDGIYTARTGLCVGGRKYEMGGLETSIFQTMTGSVAASFVDIGDVGRPSILLLGQNGTLKWTRVVANGLHYDALFLKALGGNGVCPSWCERGPAFPNPKPYGANLPGGVFKFTMTSLTGQKLGRSGTQLCHVGRPFGLETPYILFGLGRTSSYVEEFYYGLPATSRYQMWTSLIPNSQLFVFPYGSRWTLEVYISPSGILPWLLALTVGVLIVLAVIVLVLYLIDVRSSLRAKSRDQHRMVVFRT